jgi:anti-sigma-K factor RskA
MDADTHELIAGYALDALDDDERVRVEQLLEESPEARDELRSFSEVTAALATGVVGPAPPAGLRDRIVAQARDEARAAAPVAAPRRTFRFRLPALVPALSFATAAAAVLAIGLGLWGRSVNSDLDAARSALAAERAASAVLADPAALDVSLDAGSGRLVVDDAGQAVLVLDGLEQAPAGRTYQVWVVAGATPQSAGLFAGGNGRDVVLVTEDVPTGAVVAVTEEAAGGAAAPTSTPIVASKPV